MVLAKNKIDKVSATCFFHFFSITQDDTRVIEILKRDGAIEVVQFHQKCLDRYSNKKTLHKIVRDREQAEQEEKTEQKRARLSIEPRKSHRPKVNTGISIKKISFILFRTW